MEVTDLAAQIRKEQKKGPARRLRKSGFVPAIFYGRSAENMLLAVKNDALVKIHKDKKDHAFIKLIIDDGGKEKIEKLSLIKELQVQPLTGIFYHADFYEVDMKHKITVEVSLHLVGKPIGVDNGGELQHIRHEVKVSCLPANLPDHIVVDVTGLDIGDSIKIRELQIPEGVIILDSADTAVAAVAVIKVPKIEEPVEEAVVTEEGAEAVEGAEGAEGAEAADATAEPAEKGKKEKKEK